MKQKYNLLYVFADQWRRTAMGCAGEEPVLTPRMDAFAAESVRCTACTSTFPVCSPHRASLFTGRYPQTTGFFTNCNPTSHVTLREDEICLGDVLKENGYQTAYIGKWHLDEPECNYTEHPVSGATSWDAFTPPGPKRHGFDYWYSYGTFDQHLHPHYWHDTPEMIQVDQWSPEHETDVAIKWLEQVDKEKPFAAVVSWNPPHHPYCQVPQRYQNLYKDKHLPLRENVNFDSPLHCHTGEPFTSLSNPEALGKARDCYYAAVSGLDEQFGRLLDTIKRLGLEENTIVVLTADHGEMMGGHGLMTKNVWYEESIGIPFVIRGPGIGTGICDTVFGSPDQMPTLLTMLDLPIPDTVEGIDVSDSICNAQTDPEKIAFIYSASGQCWEEGKDNEWVFGAGWRGVRANGYCYVIDSGYDKVPKLQRMLYNLKEDPLQMHPEIITDPGTHPIAGPLEEKISVWLQNEKDPFYETHLKK